MINYNQLRKRTFVTICLCLWIGMAACNNKDTGMPAAAGLIAGADRNTCPEAVVTLTIDPVEKASTYQWYCNGAAIPDAAKPYYTVTESGSYTVAGVNENGLGTPSPAKVITISHCSMMERMMGEWDVMESVYILAEEGWQGPISNASSITISKIDNTTVKITGLYFGEDDEITANVDLQTLGAETITIPTQRVVSPAYTDERIFVWPGVSATALSEGYGASFHLSVKDVWGGC